jgi:hypothetical protein
MKLSRLIPLLLFVVIILAACSSGSGGDPAASVENYLQAKADSDGETIRQLLCSEMESVIEREIRTFESVSDVRIEGMACEQGSDPSIVNCAGKIVATYGAEDTEFPLSSYRVIEEDGEWKWCGEAGP